MTHVITQDLFAPLVEAVGPFEENPRVCVAVSGGADSLCLALLLREWIQEKKGTLYAAIVDHRLRPTSTQEAQTVAELLKKHQIETIILTWNDPKPTTGIQRKAREARYRLLTTWCRQHHLRHLFLAHHADDQLETVLIREARGSLAHGLAGMSACVIHAGVRILRPLLPVSGACLKPLLSAYNMPWIDDPSNEDRRFTRVQVRHQCATFSPQEKKIYHEQIQAYGILRQEEERKAYQMLTQSMQFFPEGYALVTLTLFLRAPLLTQKLALRRVLRLVRGKEKFLKDQQIDRLLEALAEGGLERGRTINGCFLKSTAGKCLICREAGLEEEILLTPQHPLDVLWDDRFLITLKKSPLKSLTLKALGNKGVALLKKQIPSGGESLRLIPGRVLVSLPSLWEEDILQEIPHLNLRISPHHASFQESRKIDRITQKVLQVEGFEENFPFLLV